MPLGSPGCGLLPDNPLGLCWGETECTAGFDPQATTNFLTFKEPCSPWVSQGNKFIQWCFRMQGQAQVCRSGQEPAFSRTRQPLGQQPELQQYRALCGNQEGIASRSGRRLLRADMWSDGAGLIKKPDSTSEHGFQLLNKGLATAPRMKSLRRHF